MNEFHRYGFIDIVPRNQFEEHKQREALAGRKIKPIDTRWSDTNKGTEAEPEMRRRLCAKEIKKSQEIGVTEIAGNASDLFASMPLIEAIRKIFSLLMCRLLSSKGKNLKVRLFDIKRASGIIAKLPNIRNTQTNIGTNQSLGEKTPNANEHRLQS